MERTKLNRYFVDIDTRKNEIKVTLVFKTVETYYRSLSLVNINRIITKIEREYNVKVENAYIKNEYLIIYAKFNGNFNDLHAKLYIQDIRPVLDYYENFKDKFEELGYFYDLNKSLYFHYYYDTEHTLPVYEFMKRKGYDVEIRGFDYDYFLADKIHNKTILTALYIYLNCLKNSYYENFD